MFDKILIALLFFLLGGAAGQLGTEHNIAEAGGFSYGRSIFHCTPEPRLPAKSESLPLAPTPHDGD